MTVGLGAMWLVVGVLVGVVGWAAASDRLPPGHWAGIRLAATTSSETAWYAGHRAAGPILQGAGGLVGATGLMLVVFRPDRDTTMLATLVLALGLVSAVVGASVVASRAARAEVH